MPENTNIIKRLAIPELMGKNFFIPDYQRGYRWDKLQIFQLISDIDLFRKYGKGSFYCLQPVIVKKCTPDFVSNMDLKSEFDNNTWYEVIDGQQRLTTIKLILTFNNLINPNLAKEDIFKIHYKTRPDLGNLFNNFSYDSSSKQILCTKGIEELDIDSYHVFRGLQFILEWFTQPGEQFEERSSLEQFGLFFGVFFGRRLDEDENEDQEESTEKSVQVLWYELKDSTNPQAVFKRLNDSKIELTNSELIRALFLSESSNFKLNPNIKYKDKEEAKRSIRQRRQAHITEQWDVIEHQLRNEDFWAFITNNDKTKYSCRVEYLFDLISKKDCSFGNNVPYGLNKRDDRYTYLYFDRELAKNKKENPKQDYLWELWKTIETYFSTLVYWYEDRDMYHWVGYLVYSIGDNILPNLLSKATTIERRAFKIYLLELILGHEADHDGDEAIAGVVNLDYASMRYPDNNQEIERVLCLYNIETYRNNPQFPFFPFRQYKAISKTIEHIHAQNSEGLPKDDNLILIKWLEENIEALKKFKNRLAIGSEEETLANGLIDGMSKSKEKGREGITFKEVSNHFDSVLTFYNSFRKKADKPSATHEFFNLTILSGESNTAVGKSAFEIKRQKIIRMDALGMFIPYCTKKVFMKYCNIEDEDFEVQQTSCWDDFDKSNYKKDIESKMGNLQLILSTLKKEEKDNE